MPLLNFQKQFVPMVEDGSKRHTIRAMRKHPISAGQTLYLYTGLRRKGARLLKRVRCCRVQQISLSDDNGGLRCSIDGETLSAEEARLLFWADGFRAGANAELEAYLFWRSQLPFVGQIIHWSK